MLFERILVIIGNGFDLGHNLPTKFDNFIESDFPHLKDKYITFQGNDKSWNQIEELYAELLKKVMVDRKEIDITEELNIIMQNYGLNEYGEVDYYNYVSEAFSDENRKISFYIELLNSFEADFLEYLKVYCSDKKLCQIKPYKEIDKIISESTKIINFNYTNTIETVYDKKDVIHIHGNIYEKIAIGCGALDEVKYTTIGSEYPTMKNFGLDKHALVEMMTFYEKDMDENLVENHFVRRFFDEVADATRKNEEKVFEMLDEKGKDSLNFRKEVIQDLSDESYDKVYIIGRSLGDADKAVLAVIKASKVICFYHGELNSDETNVKRQIMNELKWNYELRADDELYK